MKLLPLAWLSVVLLPVGVAVALLGFWVENPNVRTPLQVLGLATFGVGLWLTQRLVNRLAKDAQ